MSNTITQVLPKLLAQGVLALRQNAVTTRLVNRDYQGLAEQKGNVINVPIPSAVTATNVTPSNVYASNQDFSPTVAQISLSFWKEATFQLSDSDIVSVMEGTIPMQASEAIKAIANAIDTYVLGYHTGLFGAVGTAGTTPFNGSITAALSARLLLNRQLAPLENRTMLLDPSAEANFLGNPNVIQFLESGETAPIIKGTIGQKLGFGFYMNQNISTYTAGTGWASGNIASTVAGATGDTTLNIINATASGAIKVGDIFSLATAADAAGNQYVITAAATISATVQVAVKFYPPLKTACATGVTLVVISGTYTYNLAFHRDAFAWASRPLQDIQGYGHEMQTITDPVTGVALRLEVSRQYKQTTFSYDVMGGAQCIRPELGVKVLG